MKEEKFGYVNGYCLDHGGAKKDCSACNAMHVPLWEKEFIGWLNHIGYGSQYDRQISLIDFISCLIEQVRKEEIQNFSNCLLSCREGNFVGIGIITRETKEALNKIKE